MWKCDDCGKEFEDPKYIRECVGEFWGSPAYETWAACPYCKSYEISEKEDEEDAE